jgi:hypothetical protein
MFAQRDQAHSGAGGASNRCVSSSCRSWSAARFCERSFSRSGEASDSSGRPILMSSSLGLIAIRCFASTQTEHSRKRAGFFSRGARFPARLNGRSDFSRESAGGPRVALGLRTGLNPSLPATTQVAYRKVRSICSCVVQSSPHLDLVPPVRTAIASPRPGPGRPCPGGRSA